MKWAPLVGATLVRKSTWDQVPAEYRDAMLKIARDAGQDLREGIRRMGDDSIAAMQKRRLTVVHADATVLAEWRREAVGSEETTKTLTTGLGMDGVRENVATYTTDSVDGEDIQSIINPDEEFDLGSIVAANSANNAENDRGPGWNVTRSGCNSDKTSNGARAPTNSTPFAFVAVLNQNPCKSANRSRKIRNNASHSGTKVTS